MENARDRGLIHVSEEPWPKPSLQVCNFYHSFDLPDGTTIGGAWDLRGKFQEYIGGVDVRGKSVFDMGTGCRRERGWNSAWRDLR